MSNILSDEALDQLFREARTQNAWLDKPVTDDILRQIYDVMKWGPTSANGSPARFVFLRSPQAKQRLRPLLAPGNVEKTMAARALGLDCGPMSGFDNAKLDEEFFSAGKECEGCDQEFFPAGHVRSNFLCNLGYGDRSNLSPRNPRLEFDEACSLL